MMKTFSSLMPCFCKGSSQSFLLGLGLLATPLLVQVQTPTNNVGIGTTAPDVSAALDMVSGSAGKAAGADAGNPL
jgi:hypothetical protein